MSSAVNAAGKRKVLLERSDRNETSGWQTTERTMVVLSRIYTRVIVD